MIPCLPIYLCENLTVRQVILQRGTELVILEAVSLWAANFLAGNFLGKIGLVAVAFSVLFFDVLSYLVMLLMEKAEAERLNEKISELSSKKSSEENFSQMQPQTFPTIEAFDDKNKSVRLPLDKILYFEADGELVFAYTMEEIFQVKQRLYQVEIFTSLVGIRRVSKSHLVNLSKIQSVRPALNSRLYAKMPNGEEVLVSRKYAPELKAAIA